MGRLGWVRSNAWICDFSSAHSTTALSGGLRYNPTTSTSFSSNRLSLDSLNVSTRCGCRPRPAQMRCTVAEEIPVALAIVRQLQWVCPSGSLCNVRSTTCAIFSTGIDGLRPRPLRTSPKSTIPRCANSARHASTVGRDTPTTSAISTFDTPSAANSNARARCTTRNDNVCERASASNTSRWPSVTSNASAARLMNRYYTTVILFARHDTSGPAGQDPRAGRRDAGSQRSSNRRHQVRLPDASGGGQRSAGPLPEVRDEAAGHGRARRGGDQVYLPHASRGGQ